MRRFVAVLGVALSATVAIPAANADLADLLSFETAFEQIAAFDPVMTELVPASPPESGYQFTVGSFKVQSALGSLQHTRWSAHDGPNGPSGHVRYTEVRPAIPLDVDARGKVICVEVNGNVADVAAVLDEPALGGFTHITLRVIDNGNPVNGISPDQVFVNFILPPEPLCSFGGIMLVGETHGNAIVRDDT